MIRVALKRNLLCALYTTFRNTNVMFLCVNAYSLQLQSAAELIQRPHLAVLVEIRRGWMRNAQGRQCWHNMKGTFVQQWTDNGCRYVYKQIILILSFQQHESKMNGVLNKLPYYLLRKVTAPVSRDTSTSNKCISSVMKTVTQMTFC